MSAVPFLQTIQGSYVAPFILAVLGYVSFHQGSISKFTTHTVYTGNGVFIIGE